MLSNLNKLRVGPKAWIMWYLQLEEEKNKKNLSEWYANNIDQDSFSHKECDESVKVRDK